MENFIMLLRACRVLRPEAKLWQIMAQAHGYLLTFGLQAHGLELSKEHGTVDALVLKFKTI